MLLSPWDFPGKSTGGRERNQINKIRNEKGEVATENAERQRGIRDYYELRKVPSSETETGRNRNYEQPNYKH